MIPQISDAELVLMKLLWRQGGSALYAELMEAPDIAARGWQKNTVITLLARLGEKGLVTAEKLGRRNRYTAAVTEAEYQAAQTRSLLDKLYQGEARGLVLTLLEQQLLSPEDYDELRTLLSLALSGSVLILLLLLLLPRLRGRTSRRWQYYIWLAAVLRLLVPFAPEASLMNQLFAPPAAVSQVGSLPEEDSAAPVLPDGAEQAADSEAALPGTDPLPEENAGESQSAGSSPTENPDGDAPAGTTDYPRAGTPGGLTLPDAGQLAQAAAPAVLALWLGTALVLLICRGLTYRSFVRAVRREARPVDDPALLGCLRRASRRAGGTTP